MRWSTPSAELNEMFRKILTGFRDMSGAQWEVQKATFPPVIVQRYVWSLALPARGLCMVMAETDESGCGWGG